MNDVYINRKLKREERREREEERKEEREEREEEEERKRIVHNPLVVILNQLIYM